MNINQYTDPLNAKMSKLGPVPDFNVWLFILLIIAAYIGYIYGQTIDIHNYVNATYGKYFKGYNPLCLTNSTLGTNYTAFNVVT